jgi:hypothetical protein
MPSTMKRINITPTPEFRAWLEAYADENNMELVEALLSFASEGIKEAGFDGKITNQRGKYERELTQAMEVADRVTNYGRNDPAE